MCLLSCNPSPRDCPFELLMMIFRNTYVSNGCFLVLTDINECSNDNGGCSQKCENSPAGSFRCACDVGYQLYTEVGFNNISLAEGETGTKAGDKIRVNYTCVRKYNLYDFYFLILKL